MSKFLCECGSTHTELNKFKAHVRKYCGEYETEYLPFLVNKSSGLKSQHLGSGDMAILQSYHAMFSNQPSLKAAFDSSIPSAMKILRDLIKRKFVRMFMSVVLNVKSSRQMVSGGHSHGKRITLRSNATGSILQYDDHKQLFSDTTDVIIRQADSFTQGQSGLAITNVNTINLEIGAWS